jgi:hypothetical protein
MQAVLADTRFSKVGGKAGFEGLWVGNRGSRSGASAAAASPLLPSPQVRTHPGFPELAPGQTTELPCPCLATPVRWHVRARHVSGGPPVTLHMAACRRQGGSGGARGHVRVQHAPAWAALGAHCCCCTARTASPVGLRRSSSVLHMLG